MVQMYAKITGLSKKRNELKLISHNTCSKGDQLKLIRLHFPDSLNVFQPMSSLFTMFVQLFPAYYQSYLFDRSDSVG